MSDESGQVVEGEVVEESAPTAIAVRGTVTPATLFGTRDPQEIVERAAEVAKPLAGVIETRELFTTIRGRRHVFVEGWTLLGTMLGVFPIETWSRPVTVETDDGPVRGWEAHIEARTRDGSLVGGASGMVLTSEEHWSDRPDYALRSMAITRATSKALRVPLGFVMTLAGYEATPAEEASGIEPGSERPKARAAPKRAAAGKAKGKAKAKPRASSKGGSKATRETWDDALAEIGSRKDVLDLYRDHFAVEGTVSTSDITEEQLAELIGLARKLREGDDAEPYGEDSTDAA